MKANIHQLGAERKSKLFYKMLTNSKSVTRANDAATSVIKNECTTKCPSCTREELGVHPKTSDLVWSWETNLVPYRNATPLLQALECFFIPAEMLSRCYWYLYSWCVCHRLWVSVFLV